MGVNEKIMQIHNHSNRIIERSVHINNDRNKSDLNRDLVIQVPIDISIVLFRFHRIVSPKRSAIKKKSKFNSPPTPAYCFRCHLNIQCGEANTIRMKASIRAYFQINIVTHSKRTLCR